MEIPFEIKEIAKILIKNKHEAYLVGGCVRDLTLTKTPFDWDIATNAKPEEILQLFPNCSFYENQFGTVGIKVTEFLSASTEKASSKTADSAPIAENLEVVEITTFRLEKNYTDNRHPGEVIFTLKLEDDLSRRDFTINAMALDLKDSALKNPTTLKIIDPFQGQLDLEQKLIRAVGSPEERFKEDALRLLRAVRFATQLNFKIEAKTLLALKEKAALLKNISKERIQDEFVKIMKSNQPAQGIDLLKETKLLTYILPELEEGIGVDQNLHHVYTVYEHALFTLKNCPSSKLSVRLAALLHDVAKPKTKRGQGQHSTFYNHDFIGARIAHRALTRLRFSQKIISKVTLLIKNHMFYYEVDTVTPASVRRLLSKVGKENIKDLIDLRIADRLGSGCPKAKPYKLRHLEFLIDKVSKDPISVKMLKINGSDLKKKLTLSQDPAWVICYRFF